MSDEESANQFRREVLAVIYRYGQESNLTLYQMIGALEAVKLDMFDASEKDDDHDHS